MEKRLARLGQPLVFLLRLFLLQLVVAAGLLQLVCCDCFGALRWQTAAGGPSHFVGPFPFREPMPPAAVCHLSAAGTPTASWSTSLFGSQCLLRLSAASAPRVLQPRPGPVPCRVANAACGCLPPQRCRNSNRVLVQCPVGLSMPPAAVCHLGAAGTPTASWHGDHAHKYSRGILAWRRGHLSTLWHGDPQQKHFWGRVTWQDCLEPVSNRSLADASAGLRHDIPCERPLGGIPPWRGSHLSALHP